ncbi:MAG: glycosyltransferase family 39 protein [Chloroflexales bacterium]
MELTPPTHRSRGYLDGLLAVLGARAHLLALGAIMLLAGVLRCANLRTLGAANEYYTAGVASMLRSWGNFFFLAAEPGGSVSIDKPPLGLWVQAASAYALGVSGFAVVLPQIIAGLLAILVLSHLIRRQFGGGAGLLAALALAITPVAVAADRNNTMDSLLVLALLLAAWAFIRAAEAGRLRYLLLGATLVGLGFNMKMLQAFLPLPAFYALYLLGSPEGRRRKLRNVALASALLLVVSLSWAVMVDLTPASARPYVGSSANNTVLELIVGHNGLNRLFGGGPGGRAAGEAPPDGPPGSLSGEIGVPGLLRLVSAPLSNEVSWLLPFGLVGLAVAAAGLRLRLPLEPRHQALVLWGGWLIIELGFFSVAAFYHAYYLTMLAAPLAALVAISAAELWRMRVRRPRLAAGLLSGAAGLTLGAQYWLASAYVADRWWMPLAAAIVVGGAALLLASTRGDSSRAARVGFSGMIAAMLLTPLLWSAMTTTDPRPNVNLPHAYAGAGQDAPGSQPPAGQAGVDAGLIAYLEANTSGVTYLVATPSANDGDAFVLATGRPVLFIGGFNGGDELLSADDLAQMVAAGTLRYALWSDGQRANASLGAWIVSHGTPVSGVTTPYSRGMGPDGAQLTLYDLGVK